MLSEKSSVLIVEDNRALAQVLRFNIERAGFEVVVAYDGLDAVHRLEGQRFDLVITDLQMPVMDGSELCEHIRCGLNLTDLPIILCSAKGMEIDAAHFVVAHHVSHILYKPVSPQAVIAVVQKLLGVDALAPTGPTTVC